MVYRLDPPYTNKDFISVVILSFQRPEYTIKTLQTLHAYADMPFEVIVVDDASTNVQQDFNVQEDTQKKLFDSLPLISSLLLNNGVNRGFTNAANQAVALCNSDYVLLLNNDVEMLGPAFRVIMESLDTPYISVLGITGESPSAGGPVVTPGSVKIELSSNPQGSGAFAFRREVWAELGGFPERHHSSADIGFFYSFLKMGYFNGFIVGQPRMFLNRDREENYANPTERTTRYANGYPMLFGMPKEQYLDASYSRKELVYRRSSAEDNVAEGTGNNDWWAKWFATTHSEGKMLWDTAKLYGQERFRELIDKDIRS